MQTSWLASWFGRASLQEAPTHGLLNGRIPGWHSEIEHLQTSNGHIVFLLCCYFVIKHHALPSNVCNRVIAIEPCKLYHAEEVAEANEEEQAAWRTAWRAIGSHAWRLLDQGHLRAAARLGRALADVGASLSALLVSCPEGKRDGLPSPAVCLSGTARLLLEGYILLAVLPSLLLVQYFASAPCSLCSLGIHSHASMWQFERRYQQFCIACSSTNCGARFSIPQ